MDPLLFQIYYKNTHFYFLPNRASQLYKKWYGCRTSEYKYCKHIYKLAEWHGGDEIGVNILKRIGKPSILIGKKENTFAHFLFSDQLSLYRLVTITGEKRILAHYYHNNKVRKIRELYFFWLRENGVYRNLSNCRLCTPFLSFTFTRVDKRKLTPFLFLFGSTRNGLHSFI